MSRQQPVPVNFPDARARKGLWLFAAAVALSCHLAFVAYAIAHMHDESEDDDLGAPGIEIAFEVASPRTPPSDLPIGPESEATVAAAPSVNRTTPVEDVNLPKETPVESENPDRLVTLDTKKTPKEEEPEVKPNLTNPSEESVSQEAMAPPAVENAPEAPKATTVDQGTGASRQRARVTWQKELLSHLDKFKRYPNGRSDKNAQIIVTLNLDRTGHVVSASVFKSSGDDAFDSAALAMINRANPVPAPPPLVADENLTFSLPVNFRKNTH